MSGSRGFGNGDGASGLGDPGVKLAGLTVSPGEIDRGAKGIVAQPCVAGRCRRQPFQNPGGFAKTFERGRHAAEAGFGKIALDFANSLVAQRHLALEGTIAAGLLRQILQVFERTPRQQRARRGRTGQWRDGIVQFEHHRVG